MYVLEGQGMSYWLGLLAVALTAATLAYGAGHSQARHTTVTVQCPGPEGQW